MDSHVDDNLVLNTPDGNARLVGTGRLNGTDDIADPGLTDGDMTDDEFVAAFENCSLPLEAFRHTDHVRMAFLYLHRYPALQAIERFSSALTKFAAAHGKTNLYHETITWAYLLLIRERLARTAHPQTWPEFAAGNPDLLNWADSVLKKHYRQETLDSNLARTVFVFPDQSTAIRS